MKIDVDTVGKMKRQEKLESVILLMQAIPDGKSNVSNEVIQGLGTQNAAAWKAAFDAYPDVS